MGEMPIKQRGKSAMLSLQEQGGAINATVQGHCCACVDWVSLVQVDDVIDPADTRHWILRSMESCPPVEGWQQRQHKKRFVDTW